MQCDNEPKIHGTQSYTVVEVKIKQTNKQFATHFATRIRFICTQWINITWAIVHTMI